VIAKNGAIGGDGGARDEDGCPGGPGGPAFGGGVAGDSVTIENCTVVGNWVSAGAAGAGGADGESTGSGVKAAPLNMVDSVVWGNIGADQIFSSSSDVTYCDVQGGWLGKGNIDVDPLLMDPGAGDYHLKSEGGRWNPNSESWVLDDVTSPCIDGGDPNSPVGDELDPNGARINMGAYGGTDEASKSFRLCWHQSECAGQILGDATCDGGVNLADLFALKANFGKSAPWTDNECCADFTHDGSIDLTDVFALKYGFGSGGYSPSTGNQDCPP
jgi:hypothetical protein